MLLACICAGLTRAQLQQAFGVDPRIDITTFNALADALQNTGGSGLSALKVQLCCFLCSSDSANAQAVQGNHATVATYMTGTSAFCKDVHSDTMPMRSA